MAALIGSMLVGGGGGVAAATTVTARPNLGFANSYVVLGNSAVTISDEGSVEGTFGSDLGVSSPTGVFTNTGTLLGVGAINLRNAAAQRAQANLTAAHTAALDLSGDYTLPGSLAGATLLPGIHTADSNVTLSGNVTLDANGDPNAIFIMVVHGAFDTAANARVILANGAQAGNAYWFTGAAFTIAATADFSGRVVGGTAATLSASSVLRGQLLTTGSALTLSAGARIINDAPSGTATTVWVDQNLRAMTNGVFYSDGLSVASSDNRSVGAEDVAWAVTAGQLPPGITLDPVTGTVAGTRTDSASYSWSITATIVGNMRITKLFSTEDVNAPTVMITGGAMLLTNDRTPTISGTTDAPERSVVSVLIDGVDGTGSQAITLDTTRPALAINAGSSLINDATPTISGTTDAADGTVVTVTVANQTLLATVTDGAWSISTGALSDGNHVASAVVTDPAGNSQTATQAYLVDTVAPIVSISGGSH